MSILSDWFYSELNNLKNKFSSNVQVVYVAGGTLGTTASSTVGGALQWGGTNIAAGNGAPVEIAALDANRESLFLYNNSDTAIYFSVGSNFVDQAAGRASFRLLPAQSISFDGSEAKAAVYADAGAAAKEVCVTHGRRV
jgi:hypothetical protein